VGFSSYQAAAEDLPSGQMLSGKGEKGKQRGKKTPFAYGSVEAVAKWKGKASGGDVSVQLPAPGLQRGPSGGSRPGELALTGPSSGTGEF